MTKKRFSQSMTMGCDYQELFNFLPDGYLETDATGIIRQANCAAATLFRVNQDFLIGQSLLEFVAGGLAERQTFQNQLTQLTSPERRQGWEVRLQSGENAPFLGSLTVGVMNGTGDQPAGLRWLLHDLTERERTAEAHQNTIQELKLGYKQAIIYARELTTTITEHKQIEEALKESEERYRSLVEASPDVIVLADLNVNITMVNQQAVKLFGYERAEEMIGKSGFDFVIPEDRARAMEDLQRTFKTGYIREVEYTLLKKDRTRFPGELNLALVRDAQGMPQAFTGVLHGITKRKRAEEGLLRRANEMATLYKISLEINAQPDLATLLRVIMHQATTLLRTDRGELFLLQSDGQTLEMVAAHNLQADFQGVRLHPGEGLAGRVAQMGQPLMVTNYQSWPGKIEPLKFGPAGRVLGVPLKQREQVIGVLIVLDNEKTEEFIEDDIRLLGLFANQAAIAIENARLHTKSERWTEQLTILNKASRMMASSLDLSQVLEQVIIEATTLVKAQGASLLLLKPEGDELVFVASISSASEQLIGARMPAAAGIAGWTIQARQSVLVADAQADARFYPGIDAITHLTTRSLIAVPLIARNKVIGVIEVTNKLAGIFDQADLDMLEALGSSAAIAIENAQLFETIHHSQERYRHLFDNSPISIREEDFSEVKAYLDRLRATGFKDLNLYFEQHPKEVMRCARMVKVVEVNQACVALYQANHKEALLTGLAPIFTQERYDTFRKQLVAMAAGQIAYECETINQTLLANKVRIWLRSSIAPGYEATWSKVLVCILDITALKQAEAVMRKQRQELRRLSTQLINTQEAERKHLAHELHDEMGQALTAIGLNLEVIEQELAPSFSPTVTKRLADTISLVDQTLAQIRELSLNLRPSMLDDLGLEATLSWYVKQYAARSTVAVELDTQEFEGRLKAEVEIALYRVVQEALTNVARHAQAQRVYLRLVRRETAMTVLIEDDGRGFNLQEVTNRQASEPGLGLIGIRERVTALGGQFDVQSQPGQGTRLFVGIPLSDERES